ncbi:MAG: hypothetical protein ACE10K_01880, partial [Rhodothermales bacterium]
VDWLSRELIFEQRPLRRILDELAHHLAITFEVSAALGQETATGRLFLYEKEQSLTDLGAILEGRFVEVDNDTYRFEAN